MKIILALLAMFASVAHAQQPVTVIGPVTVGNCAQFFSTTQIKSAAGNCGGAVSSIPNGTPMLGSLLATAIAAPINPGAGKSFIYVDSTTKALVNEDDTGQVHTTIIPGNAPGGSFVTGVTTAGALTFGAPTIPSAANPTATAGPTAVNGSASTFMRSDAAPAVQTGSNSQLGLLQCDNTTTICTAGVIQSVAPGISSITVGATTVTGGTDGYNLIDQSGKVGVSPQTSINIKGPPYNAVGDCSTDDTAAIQAAIDASVAANGTPVYIPPVASCYLVTSQINISGRTYIYGAASSRVNSVGGSIIKTNNATGNVFSINESYNGITFYNFYIDSSVTKTSGAGINITCTTCASGLPPFSIYIEQMNIFNMFIGVDCKKCSTIFMNQTQISNETSSGGPVGLRLAQPLNVDGGEHWITNNFFEGGSSYVGIEYDSGGGLRVIGNKFLAGNIGFLLTSVSGIPFISAQLVISGNSFDGNVGWGIRATSNNGGDIFDGTVISSNIFTGGGAAVKFIEIGGSVPTNYRNLNITGNNFQANGATAISLLLATNVIVDSNIFTAFSASASAVACSGTISATVSPSNQFNGTWSTKVSGCDLSSVPLAFTPTWTSTGSPPSIGNGQLTGTYAVNGNLVTWNIVLSIGSTTNVGSGDYRFSLPVTVASGGYILGNSVVNQAATSQRFLGQLEQASGTSVFAVNSPNSSLAGYLGAAAPVSLVSGDSIVLGGQYYR